VFEILFGMTGFFADFKNSLLTLLVAAMSTRPRFRPQDLAVLGSAVALLIGIGVFWSTIKPDYREFVNQGTGEQVVLVSLEERIAFIANRALDFDGTDVHTGLERLVSRHGYIDYLAQTMEFVPRGLPHEDGALTSAVLRHVTMPRFLFPDKPALPNDTEIMAKYTGQEMVWNRSTSISIGHLAELYIDFGYIGGLLGMLTLGLLVGFSYRILRNHNRTPALISAAISLTVALQLAYFGIAYSKIVGALIFSFAIAVLFQRLVVPFILSRIAFRMLRPV